MGPAARLISDEKNFLQGSLYRKADYSYWMPGDDNPPVIFDCLGAFLWAYRDVPHYDRHITARRVFEACRARHGHTRLGKLIWDEAFDLLKGCGV